MCTYFIYVLFLWGIHWTPNKTKQPEIQLGTSHLSVDTQNGGRWTPSTGGDAASEVTEGPWWNFPFLAESLLLQGHVTLLRLSWPIQVIYQLCSLHVWRQIKRRETPIDSTHVWSRKKPRNKKKSSEKKNQGTKQMTQEHIHRYSELSGGCSGELAGGRAQG